MSSIHLVVLSIDEASGYAASMRVARKGWLEQEQELNGRDCAGVLRWFTDRKWGVCLSLTNLALKLRKEPTINRLQV